MIGSIGRLGCFVLATILCLVRFTRLSPNEDFPIVVVLHGDPLDIIVTEILVLTLRKANVDHASNEIALNSVLENR